MAAGNDPHGSAAPGRARAIDRRAFLRRAGVATLLLSATGLLAACQQAAPPSAPTQAPAQTPAPASASGSSAEASMSLFNAPGSQIIGNFGLTPDAVMVGQATFDSLMEYDSKFNLKPKLAESWDISSDNRTYTFKLRQGVKWSDGTPFTARDVEATVLTMSDPKVVCPWTSYIDPIDGYADRKAGRRDDLPGLQVVDDNTLKVTTTQPSAVLPDLFGTEFVVLPEHILDTVPPDQLIKSKFALEPTVSTGPFHVVKNTDGQVIELERNPNYWGAPPKLDRVFLKIMTPQAGIAALESGALDVIPGGSLPDNVPATEVDRLSKNTDITITSFPFNFGETLQMNDRTTLQDPRVRQAIMYAIDREKIVQEVLLGHAKVAYSVYAEYTPWYVDGLDKYALNPDKARQLLNEANWNGSTQLTFLAPGTDQIVQNIAAVVQQQLEAVGIHTRIELLDQPTLVSRGQNTHTFDLALTTNRGYNNPDLARRFASSSYENGVNWGGYSNPDLDKLIQDVDSKPTIAEQKPIAAQIQQIINKDVPVGLMYYQDAIGAVNTKRLGGATPNNYVGMHRTMGQWFLK